MTLLKFTSHMLSNQPDQTAYLLNKLAEGHGGGGIGTLYDTTGQHTDGAMTQKATTNALGAKADAIAVGQALAGKVDKVPGKELSSNDFTNEELGKLNGIQAGAEVNVQADWDQTDTSADDYIKNKPTIPAGSVLYPSTGQNTDGAMTQKASSDLFNNAVYVGTGSVGTLTPWVDTSEIVDDAVTVDKIDWSTVGAGFNRYVTTSQTAAAGSQTVIKLGGVVGTDSGVTYDSNTGIFTITKAGWWTFAGGVGGAVSAATTVLASIAITSGGSTYQFTNRVYHFNTAWGVYIGVSAVFKLSVGDTVMLYIEPTENQMTAINNYTRGHLAGTLVCPA